MSPKDSPAPNQLYRAVPQISVGFYEALLLGYLGHVYLRQERLVPIGEHNGTRRQRLLLALQEATGPCEDPSLAPAWIEKRRQALEHIRQLKRDELQELLKPFMRGEEWRHTEEVNFVFVPELLFGHNRDIPLFRRMAKSKQAHQLAELALDILDLAGRQDELEHIAALLKG